MSFSRWVRLLRGVPEPEDVEDAPSELLPPHPSELPPPDPGWRDTADAHDPSMVPAPDESDEMLEVYADAMMSEGDARGELVALMLRGKDKHATALRKHHRRHFYGPVTGWTVRSMHRLEDVRVDPKRRFAMAHDRPVVDLKVFWRAGFIDALWVQVEPERIDALLAFLRHPSCARLRVLILGGTRMYGLGERLAEQGPFPTIERLHIGDFTIEDFVMNEADQGVWPELDRVFPNLRHLAANGVPELGPLPALKTLQITRETAFARVDWGPEGRLADLQMARLCGAQAEALLDRRDLGQLTDLRLGREITKSFAKALARWPERLAGLEVLGFQRCDMRNAARPLVALVPKLPALQMLYVPSDTTAYHQTLSHAFPGRIGVAPPEMRYAHFWREVGELELGVLTL